jgi:haloalkane dehalogenase
MLRSQPPWLQALFPWEHKALRVNGRTMDSVEHGAGDPILMLHDEPTWRYLYRHRQSYNQRFLRPATVLGSLSYSSSTRTLQ